MEANVSLIASTKLSFGTRSPPDTTWRLGGSIVITKYVMLVGIQLVYYSPESRSRELK